jgi:hypothetical protein
MGSSRHSISYQEGHIERIHRVKGPDQWTYRWWETSKHGNRIHRRKIIGTVETYPTIQRM